MYPSPVNVPSLDFRRSIVIVRGRTGNHDTEVGGVPRNVRTVLRSRRQRTSTIESDVLDVVGRAVLAIHHFQSASGELVNSGLSTASADGKGEVSVLLGIFLNRNGDGAGATLAGSSNTITGSAGDQEVAAGGTLNIGGAGAEMQGTQRQ